MNTPGIDYSFGRQNRDNKGISFGSISQHSLSCWALDDFDAEYGEKACPECTGEVVEFDSEKHDDYPIHNYAVAEYACESCQKVYEISQVMGEEALYYSYTSGEYNVRLDSHGDVTVLSSPYYTYAQYCSPCMPGGGQLDYPCFERVGFQPRSKKKRIRNKHPKKYIHAGTKTYCLGHDWFTGGIAPYPVYSVVTGKLVEPDNK